MSTSQAQDQVGEPGIDPLGRVFDGLFREAWSLHKEGKREESGAHCRRLLAYPSMGDFHRAGCHLLLGRGQDNYVWHAEQAVDLYENLYIVRPGGSFTGEYPPTAVHVQQQEDMIKQARKVLAKAREDENRIKQDYAEQTQRFVEYFGRNPTNEELVAADYDRHRYEVEEYFLDFDEAMAAAQDYSRHDDDEDHRDDDHDKQYDSDIEFPSVKPISRSPSPQAPMMSQTILSTQSSVQSETQQPVPAAAQISESEGSDRIFGQYSIGRAATFSDPVVASL